jgi:uncharacterized membrane protein SpoIIM required for sporulation
MKEKNFIRQNNKKWSDLEKLLESDRKDPDRLSELYIQVTDDLSFARTFYKNRSVRIYLNNIVQIIYYQFFRNTKISFKDFTFFWREELPWLVYDARKALLSALFFFLVCVGIGVFTSIQDPDFAEVVLGSRYIAMTEENIESGDAMAVYQSSKEVEMMLSISFNNLRVSFITFASGIFFGMGTLMILLHNGVMLGAFQYFFIERDLFWESFLAIWMHGTIEISCIVLAGGAGLRLGSGLLFPGTYSRIRAFQISAMQGAKLMLGIFPLIILAALIESFFTRYTDAPDWARLFVILSSLLFILTLFIFYPALKARRGFHPDVLPKRVKPTIQEPFDQNRIYSHVAVYGFAVSYFKAIAAKLLLPFTVLACACSAATVSLFELYQDEFFEYFQWNLFRYLFSGYYPVYFHILLTVCLFIAFLLTGFFILKKEHPETKFFPFIQRKTIKLVASIIGLSAIVWIGDTLGGIITLALLPICFVWFSISLQENQSLVGTWKEGLSLVQKRFGNILSFYVLSASTAFLFYSFFQPYNNVIGSVAMPSIPMLVAQFSSALFHPEGLLGSTFWNRYFPVFIASIGLLYVLAFIQIGFYLLTYSLKEIVHANHLKSKIELLKSDEA